MDINKIAIIGTGNMGPKLAAFFAGCGTDVLLFGRKTKAKAAKKALSNVRPKALYTAADLDRISCFDLECDVGRLAECDWIIECIVDRLDKKRVLYEKIAPYINDDAILTSNTSGLSLKNLSEHLGPNVKSKFFITHFFYPPRYIKLVEIVSGLEVDKDAVSRIQEFLTERCGKGIVYAKDTPNFIANRIGVQYVMDAMHLVVEKNWPIEAVDSMMAFPVGWPSTAIFRMADMVGIDTVIAVAGTAIINCPNDPFVERCRIPQYIQQMVARGWTGAKGGQGFYKKDGDKRLVLDPLRLSYRPQLKFTPRSIVNISNERDPSKRIKSVVFAGDPGSEISWRIISNAIVYATDKIYEIAEDFQSIDKAMRWGFGWELGPFETWDALGLKEVASRLEADGRAVPQIVTDLLRSGKNSFYEEPAKKYFFSSEDRSLIINHRAGKMIDIGDGVALLSLGEHSGAWDRENFRFFEDAIRKLEREFRGMIITNEGDTFFGYDYLYEILNKARLKKFGGLDEIAGSYQDLLKRIRYSLKPIVAAPAGKVGGIGLELCNACFLRYSWVESLFWFDHMLLGFVPMAGGSVDLLRRFEKILKKERDNWQRCEGMCVGGGPYPKVSKVFKIIGGAARSDSAYDAVEKGLLGKTDRVAMDKERLISEAKEVLIEIADDYVPLNNSDLFLPGKGGEVALLNDMRYFSDVGLLSDENKKICQRLAYVLSGGDYPVVHYRDEESLLELERDAFLSLSTTELAKERIEKFLKRAM